MSFATVVTADNENNYYTIEIPGEPGIGWAARNISLTELEEGEIVELIDIDNKSPSKVLQYGMYRINKWNPGDFHWYGYKEVAEQFPNKFLYSYFYSCIHNPRWQREYPLYRKGKVKEIVSGTQMIVYAEYEGMACEALCYVDYLKCHAYAFEVGDHAVIRYNSPGLDLPCVIGFWYDPKGCWFEDWEDDVGGLCGTNHWALSFIGIFGDIESGQVGNDEWEYGGAVWYAQWIWGDCSLPGHPTGYGAGRGGEWPSYQTINGSCLTGKFVQEYPDDYETNPFQHNYYGGMMYTFKGIENYPITEENQYSPGPDYPPIGYSGYIHYGNPTDLVVVEGMRTWYEGIYSSSTDHPFHIGAVSIMLIDSQGNYAYMIFLLNEPQADNYNPSIDFLVYDGLDAPYTHSGATVAVRMDTMGLDGRIDEIRLLTESTWKWRRVPCFSWDKIGFFPLGAYPITYP
jgi:hypothetical protein